MIVSTILNNFFLNATIKKYVLQLLTDGNHTYMSSFCTWINLISQQFIEAVMSLHAIKGRFLKLQNSAYFVMIVIHQSSNDKHLIRVKVM